MNGRMESSLSVYVVGALGFLVFLALLIVGGQ